ncbi:sce7726 family protein [Sulfurimonas sp. HSL1-6]|uniref:sce7726 family protein n=1 Tax=Thiomicrolovo immobilis TaxID=3131935 RepID=UPI0031F78090
MKAYMTEANKIKIALYKKIFQEIKQGYIAVPELSLFSAVADMIVVNGDIHIYEIKSKMDSLSRLESQLSRFKKCANKVTVVADEKFIPKLIELPSMNGVGIISVNNKNQLKDIREAVSRPMHIEDYLAYWTSTEIKASLRGLEGYSKLSVSNAKERLLKLVNVNELNKITVYKLKEKYGKEFIERKKLIKEKNYEKALESRFRSMIPEQTTPLRMLPAFLFKDFNQEQNS